MSRWSHVGRSTTLGVLLLVLAIAGVLAGVALTIVPLDFPQFVIAFTVGDARNKLVSLLAGSTSLAALVWKMRSGTGPMRTVARATTVVGFTVVLAAAFWEFGYYTTREVSFTSMATRIGGRLYIPRSSNPHRAVILVPGSENADGGRYHSFADRLARANIAVLVPDKRGVGRSGGVFQPPSADDARGRALLDTLAADAAAGIRFLRTVPGVDSRSVGYFGLSQAGWVIPLAELQSGEGAFAVIVSGPAVSFSEEDLFSKLSDEQKDHFGWNPPPISFDSLNARLDREVPGGFDPRSILRRLTLPVLWIYGSWDNSIPTAKSARVLEALRSEGKAFTIRTFEYGNHGLFVMRGPAKRLLPYYPQGLWPGVVSWVDSVTAVK